MFNCDETYRKDLEEYTESIVKKMGPSSPIAVRELLILSEAGNTVAAKLYGDLIFYGKLPGKHRLSEAFDLYLRASGITVTEGKWESSGRAYPLAFWMVGYYLVNYRCSSVLKECEKIEAIDSLSASERLEYALELACSCYSMTKAPGASNLMGRILREIAGDKDLYEKLKDFAMDRLNSSGIENRDEAGFEALAKNCFLEAARGGYVYAANNLAAEEASVIAALPEDDVKRKDATEHYIEYLKLSADRFEPYAANRLGMFFLTGEISSGEKTVKLREYVDKKAAKKYFEKAIRCPDANSAWAYYNLLRAFPNDFIDDLDLQNEYLDRIRELDPAVYDLAIEL